jgi:hypothetical protein
MSSSIRLYYILSTHWNDGGEDVDVGLLGCNAVWTCKWVAVSRGSEKYIGYRILAENWERPVLRQT